MKNKEIPSIRFPEFNEAWEQHKLDDIVEFYSGLTYSPDNVQKKGTFVLRSSNVKNGEIVDADNVYVSHDVVNSGNVLEGDVIVVVRNGSRDLIGKHAQIKQQMNNTVIGAFMTGVRSETPDFTNAMLDTQQFAIEINKNLGATINQITTGAFKKMHFVVPKDKDEREAIGTFFKQLDNTIALHQRKLDLLKEIKKGFLQKMFPKNGENTPEIRFGGFTNVWEQSKFFDIIENTIDFRGRTPKKLGMDWSERGFLALSALNVKKGYIDPTVDAHYGGQKLYDKWMNGKELRKGQVLFTTEAPMGNVAQVPDNKGYILSQRVISFDVKQDKITNDFLAVLLGSPKVFNNLSSLSSGGTAKGVSQKSLSQLNIYIPKEIEEQQYIGKFFKKLDNTISLHQRELELLQETKKALLQKMFV